MLTFSPWKIDQVAFDAALEPELEKQLAFSNGYISQYAFFEEHYSGPQSVGTYLRDIATPLPLLTTVSVRLMEERLDLHYWEVLEFERSLSRQQPLLQRRVLAKSPSGHTLEIRTERMLRQDNPHLLSVRYEVRSVDYSGTLNLLSLMGDSAGNVSWFPLKLESSDAHIAVLMQSFSDDLRVALATRMAVEKNGETIGAPRIRIEKKHISGYSLPCVVAPGDVVVLKKDVAITDSLNYPSMDLFQSAVEYLKDR